MPCMRKLLKDYIHKMAWESYLKMISTKISPTKFELLVKKVGLETKIRDSFYCHPKLQITI